MPHVETRRRTGVGRRDAKKRGVADRILETLNETRETAINASHVQDRWDVVNRDCAQNRFNLLFGT